MDFSPLGSLPFFTMYVHAGGIYCAYKGSDSLMGLLRVVDELALGTREKHCSREMLGDFYGYLVEFRKPAARF